MQSTPMPMRRRMTASEPSAESVRLAAVGVYEQLRREIIALDMAPGLIINRADLQARFGLSSTPLRDALMRLAGEGLIEIVPQSATRVSLIDIDAAREAQFLRRALEMEAVEMIIAAPDRSVVRVLRRLIEEQKVAAASEDFPAFDALDSLFHRRIFEAAHAGNLFHLVRKHAGHIDRIRRLNLPVAGKMNDVIANHTMIVNAIEDGDAAAARLSMRDHLSRSLAFLPELRDRHPHFFKPER